MNVAEDHDEADLLRNCLAFLERAVEDVTSAGQDPQILAYASVDLAVAIEVLLKARLVREHWALICVEPGRTNLASFRNGDMKTISPEDAIDRLMNVAHLNLRPHLEQVKAVARLRNRAAHFRLPSRSPSAVRAELGQGLDFAAWFVREEFLHSSDAVIADLAKQTLDVVGGPLVTIKEYTQSRLTRFKDDLDKAHLVLECPRCSSPSVVGLDDCKPQCVVCETEWLPEEAAAEYVSTVLGLDSYSVVKDGGEWPVHQCPECDVESFVPGVHDAGPARGNAPAVEGAGQWACFNCGHSAGDGEVDRCSDCGRPIRAGDRWLCSDCTEYRMDRD